VSRWPTAWARCKGNVIDEPTAPQNLELGQVDLIKTEDLSDSGRRGGGSLNPGLEANQGQLEARISISLATPLVAVRSLDSGLVLR
jgi:hypothetical protein